MEKLLEEMNQLYRSENDMLGKLKIERNNIIFESDDVEKGNKEMTVKEYKRLKNRLEVLKHLIPQTDSHCNGISEARELLLDRIGELDTK